MDNILNRPIVLVLNRNWQAINVRTPQQAFVQMATDVATALDVDGENMVPARWAQWIKLPVRVNDYAIRTPSGPMSPVAPRELPSTLFIRNVNGIAAWRHFLVE